MNDPPYESLEKHRAVATTTRLKHSKASSKDCFTVVAKPIAERAGFPLWKPVVWRKVLLGNGVSLSIKLRVFFFEEGKRRLNDLGIPDVIVEKRIVRGYPTEKPLRVKAVLIEQSSAPGESIP